ncbi:hypothetical protein NDA11_006195 [Ustilago hordei]|nr:hypothetical protein NDA10_004620 [Ustilago hordei]KAJ1570969.1 hypothetical protein NDA11_006195 [Ustilago hordei]
MSSTGTGPQVLKNTTYSRCLTVIQHTCLRVIARALLLQWYETKSQVSKGLCPLFDTVSPTGIDPVDAAPLPSAQHTGYATLPFCLHAPFPLDDV